MDDPSWGTDILSEEFVLEKSLVDTGMSQNTTHGNIIGQKYVQIPELEGKIPSSDEPIYEITNQQAVVI